MRARVAAYLPDGTVTFFTDCKLNFKKKIILKERKALDSAKDIDLVRLCTKKKKKKENCLKNTRYILQLCRKTSGQ
ncbi:Methyl-CpG-binding domain protein 5 [Frankliniella fusca]|uniref:Methyl-CpG-binding domain protein 5 n=1 Tax=Frankliniella fusca TaxID=407009 RepID=A0AAE1L5M3_9NEOP|nr:Methyl-CpG-binding domain protein 5 [Frankliniella fusca]